jgi:hypothetical protein
MLSKSAAVAVRSAQVVYDAAGRLSRLTGPGLPPMGVRYHRLADPTSGAPWGDLIDRIDYDGFEGAMAIASTIRTYEPCRNLLADVENTCGEATISAYGHANDDLARRTSVLRTGSAFVGGSGDHFDLYEYNYHNELTCSRRYSGTDPANPDSATPVEAGNLAWGYDGIGNRKWCAVGLSDCPWQPTGGDLTTYTVNSLNQYTEVRPPNHPSRRRSLTTWMGT